MNSNYTNNTVNKLTASDYYKNFSLKSKTKKILLSLKQEIFKTLSEIDEKKLSLKKIAFKNVNESSKYFDDSIQALINKKGGSGYSVVYVDCDKLLGFNLNLNFYTLRGKSVTKQKIMEYAKIMLSWLKIAKQYEKPSCIENLDVNIYLANVKKEISALKEKEILGQKHANTAFTYRCHNGSSSITLFREEDLVKVFIHETFHTFKFDFDETCNSHMKKTFNLNIEFMLFESYCETWARIIHSIYFSILIDKDKTTLNSLESILALEGSYSFLQCCKVLNYMDITLFDILTNSKIAQSRYKQDSHIFSYYVVTAFLMTHIDEFLYFCNKYNKPAIIKFNKVQNGGTVVNDNLGLKYLQNQYVRLINDIKENIKKSIKNKETNDNEVSINIAKTDRSLKMVLFNCIN
jgi:hypothetical protein